MRHALYLERTQQFVRTHNVAATFAMSVNDPTPTISGNGAAIAPRPAGSVKLVSDDFRVFHWRHDARISESGATASNDHENPAIPTWLAGLFYRFKLAAMVIQPISQQIRLCLEFAK